MAKVIQLGDLPPVRWKESREIIENEGHALGLIEAAFWETLARMRDPDLSAEENQKEAERQAAEFLQDLRDAGLAAGDWNSARLPHQGLWDLLDNEESLRESVLCAANPEGEEYPLRPEIKEEEEADGAPEDLRSLASWLGA